MESSGYATGTPGGGLWQYVKRRTATRRPVKMKGEGPQKASGSTVLETINSSLLDSDITSTQEERGSWMDAAARKRKRSHACGLNGDSRRGWMRLEKSQLVADVTCTDVRQPSVMTSVWCEGVTVLQESTGGGEKGAREKGEENASTSQSDGGDSECRMLSQKMTVSSDERMERGTGCEIPQWGVRGQRRRPQCQRNEQGLQAEEKPAIFDPWVVKLTRVDIAPVNVNVSNNPSGESTRPSTPSIEEEKCPNRLREVSGSGTSGETESENGFRHEKQTASRTGVLEEPEKSAGRRDLRRKATLQEIRPITLSLHWDEMAQDFKECGSKLRQKPKLRRPRKVEKSLQSMGLCLRLANRKLTLESVLQEYLPAQPENNVHRQSGLRGMVRDDEEGVLDDDW